MSSSFASGSGGGSEIGGRHGSSGSNGDALAGDNTLISAPVSSSPAPPPSTNSVQPPKPTGAGAVTGAATPRKPAPKPAAKPIAKPAISTTPSPVLANRPSYRDKRFAEVLGEDIVKLDELRKLSWNGVPQVHRAAVWQLLVGYMPANRSRRAVAMERKRREYREAVPQYFDVPDAARSHQEQNILRQILVDVPRTCPDVPFFHQDKVTHISDVTNVNMTHLCDILTVWWWRCLAISRLQFDPHCFCFERRSRTKNRSPLGLACVCFCCSLK